MIMGGVTTGEVHRLVLVTMKMLDNSKHVEHVEIHYLSCRGELRFLLYCIVLYCIVLYCIVLYCTVLYCIYLPSIIKK